MVDWKEIHPDFTEELQKEWEDRGFDYEQCQEWANSLKDWFKFNLKNPLHLLCSWLRDNKKLTPQEVNVDNIDELAKEYNNFLKWEQNSFTYQETKSWMNIGLSPNDYNFACYLNKKGYQSNNNLNLKRLKAEYTQAWLDRKYPKENRRWIKEVYLNEPSLEGNLNFKDFTGETILGEISKVKVHISSCVNENKLTFKNLPKGAEVFKCVNAQKYFNKKYPTKEERKKVRELIFQGFRRRNLEGELNLSNFTNLEKIDFENNKLTSLNINYCSNLTKLNCNYNLLTNIVLPDNSTSLKKLGLSNNNFNQDLSFLTSCINLEYLDLENNKLVGSLDHLSNMKQLKEFDISNTDINEINPDKIPKSLERVRRIKYHERIEYFSYKRHCKLKEIVPQLEKFKYGFCKECLQLNTSKDWCQFCAEQEWKKLTGQELIEKFIQQQELRESKRDKKFEIMQSYLEWIPYEQFTDIKYLAEGGFSQIYKAYWKKGWWLSSENFYVALKILNNSQNITSEFLTEISNTKLIDEKWGSYTDRAGENASNIVECFGISQDPITKNYVMVMQYMKEGNLRQYLQQGSNRLNLLQYLNERFMLLRDRLSLEEKLKILLDIVKGLNKIHEKNLIHRDFHSGNILKSIYSDSSGYFSKITDLGLSQPINHQEEGQIFGVLPYVAPEVLRSSFYTKASDIYSFGIIAYELFASSYPYPEMDDMDLSLKVCNGYRPNLDKVPLPQLLKDLIKRCWDSNPDERPKAEELKKIIDNWRDEITYKKNTNNPFYQQYQAIKAEYNTSSKNTPYQIHPNATPTSKMIDTKEITKKLETMRYSEDLAFDFTNLNLEENTNNQNWTNIHPNFTSELIQFWTNLNFTYSQTQEWINIGLQSTDYNFCAWLRDNKHFTPEQVLNKGNLEQLNQEFFTYWQEQQQANIEISPK